jgi:uncharacterized protein (DUF2252 family)
MIVRHKRGSLSKSRRNESRRVTPVVIAPSRTSRSSPDELYRHGRDLRKKCPRQSHAAWAAPDGRSDPLSLLRQSSAGRIPELIPIRYGRMLQSPFAFFRGAALNMAADLARTRVTGLRVQACGDCHLLNFGMFATPERREIFDINDLDETLPAPWEWDLKRLATSFVLASRNNGLDKASARDAALACVRSYRRRMAEFSQMRVLDIWYAKLDVDALMPQITDEHIRRRIETQLAAARNQSVIEHDFPKLAEVVRRMPVIKDNPPLIYHGRERHHVKIFEHVKWAFARYRQSLEEDRRVLLDRYEVRDAAIKVVGIGSVGTRCGIILLMAGRRDPLFLQVKEARASVLEACAGKSVFPNHGQRVVNGARLMQSASDLFLGWTVGPQGRHYYIRQLRDVKVKMMVETFNSADMIQYAKLCGWALARAHARSGEPAKISGYLGSSDKFDDAIARFASAYADQTERDHKVLKKAVRDGKLQALSE